MLLHFKTSASPLMAVASSIKEKETNKPKKIDIADKIRNSRVLVLGGTGRVGGSTAVALSKLSPELRIVVGGRNRYFLIRISLLFVCNRILWVVVLE